MHKHPNLVKAQPKPATAEQRWVADITYIETRETTGYLRLVADAYSRWIMRYRLHASLHTDGVLKAWNMAMRCRGSKRQLTHHSDRGLQYCAESYRQAHRRHGVLCSVTEATIATRTPWQNGSTVS